MNSTAKLARARFAQVLESEPRAPRALEASKMHMHQAKDDEQQPASILRADEGCTAVIVASSGSIGLKLASSFCIPIVSCILFACYTCTYSYIHTYVHTYYTHTFPFAAVG